MESAARPSPVTIGGPLLAALLAALLTAGSAHAQTSDPAAAQAMFDEAKQLVVAGRLAEACPKFLASFKLDPKPGSLVNLADCYEKNGQLASAWARYHEASSLAQRAGQVEREQYARERAAAVEPRLSRLTVAAAVPPQGLEVRRDGAVLDVAMLGSAVPVDPGKHMIEARAPGKKTWSTSIDVPAIGGRVKVDIPALEDGVSTGPAVPPAAEPPLAGQPGGAPAPVPFWGAQRIAGLAGGIAGLAGVAVGSAFGAIASSKWSSTKNDHCGGTTVCDAMGVTLAGDARSAANVSTGAFIPGAALLVTGVVVFATAPRTKSPPTTGFVVAPIAHGGAVFTLTGAL